ncbi:GRF1-interacting factor 1-like [Salvia splendens]|uniref:GRF1-interacting factor 1-like n=1 Tax=Salvia splendens TaxID=180675 RepID=UPI001C263965|nr:GRF1-interacting factor 1-like [Salvia splendens]
MQQHLMQMQPMMAAYYPSNVTTDHIQQYLDENKSLILKIVESQNSGKLSECAENQARLQRNLMYLAAIADSQPHPPTMHSQYAAGGGGMMQAGGAHYLQQAQQQSLMAARSSMLYGSQPYPSLQQQALHNQLGMSSGGLMLQGEPHSAAASSGLGFPDFVRGGSSDGGMQSRGMGKQDMGSEGRGDGGETLYLKSSEDGN